MIPYCFLSRSLHATSEMKLFDSPAREDGSEKWVDYAYSFWHVDCVRKIGLKNFTERYKSFCKKHHYNFQPDKPEKLFAASKDLVSVFPKEKTYKLLIQQSIQQLNLASEHVERLRKEMNTLASTLPEYSTVMGIYGVGKTYGPQLIAEIGDVSRFTHREALTAFTGVDPGVDESASISPRVTGLLKLALQDCAKRCFRSRPPCCRTPPKMIPSIVFLIKNALRGSLTMST